eukprot:scaffold28171_cov34-Prasinocladus_malaysianus.AAC.1
MSYPCSGQTWPKQATPRNWVNGRHRHPHLEKGRPTCCIVCASRETPAPTRRGLAGVSGTS